MHGQDFDKFACATLILHNTQFNASLLHINTLVLPKKNPTLSKRESVQTWPPAEVLQYK